MTQRSLDLPPVSSELPLGEHTPITTCGYCNRLLPQGDAFRAPDDDYCNKSCRDMAHLGDGA